MERKMENNTPVCTCDKEKFPFVTEPCPVHPNGSYDPYLNQSTEEDAVVIKDEFLVPDKIRVWKGHVFKCPECNTDAIMHFFKYCSKCGAPIIVESYEVSNFIRNGGK
jgi:hypothetical protein